MADEPHSLVAIAKVNKEWIHHCRSIMQGGHGPSVQVPGPSVCIWVSFGSPRHFFDCGSDMASWHHGMC